MPPPASAFGRACAEQVGDASGWPCSAAFIPESPPPVIDITEALLHRSSPDGRTIIGYARAQELGLGLVPAEVGPALRLQYPDQPNGERVLICMKPIADSSGHFLVLCMDRHSDTKWLLTNYANPDYEWLPESLCVRQTHRGPRKRDHVATVLSSRIYSCLEDYGETYLRNLSLVKVFWHREAPYHTEKRTFTVRFVFSFILLPPPEI